MANSIHEARFTHPKSFPGTGFLTLPRRQG
jgi:hypothetical protein